MGGPKIKKTDFPSDIQPIAKVLNKLLEYRGLKLNLPDKAPFVDFLNSNGCDVPKDALWPDILKGFDSCHLWDRAGDIFRKHNLVHPFDPFSLPQKLKKKLDHYKNEITKGERKLTCEEVDKILLDHSDEICVYKSGDSYEARELTAAESALKCMNGENPGTCSEAAYRYAAESLYLNGDCPLDVRLWSRHIEICPKDIKSNMCDYSVINSGDNFRIYDLNKLFLVYYLQSTKKNEKIYTLDDELRKEVFLLNLDPLNSVNLILNSSLLLRCAKGDFYKPGRDNLGLMVSCWQTLQTVTNAMKDREYSTEMLYWLISVFLDNNNFKKLEETAKSLAKIDPWDYISYQAMKAVSLVKGDFAKMLDFSYRAESLKPRVSKNFIDEFLNDLEGVMQNWKEKMQQRIKYYIAKTQSPNETTSEVWRGLGKLYDFDGRVEDALEAFENALAIDPFDDEAMGLYLPILMKVGNANEAEDVARTYLSFNWDSLNANSFLYFLFLKQERMEELKSLVEDWKDSKNPELRAAYFMHYGADAYSKNDFYAASQWYRMALKHLPDEAGIYKVGIYIKLADIVNLLGERNEALKLIEKARDLDPFELEAFYELAKIYRDRGEVIDASKWAKLYSKLSSDRTRAFSFLGDVSFSMGKYNEARSFLSESLKEEPEDESALSMMTIISYEEGNPEYKDYLGRLEKAGLGKLEYYYALARMAEKDGDTQKAAEFYRAVMAMAPGYRDALHRLEKLGGSDLIDGLNDDPLPHAIEYVEGHLGASVK